jgi:hypothetical protein
MGTEDDQSPPPEPPRSQEPDPNTPWITLFPKDVRGPDMATWGRTTAEMATKVRGAFKQNEELKAALAEYQKGVPANEDEYTFSVPEEAAALIKPEEIKDFQKLAHKLKLPSAAAQDLFAYEYGRYIASAKARQEASVAQSKALVEELRGEYKDKTEAVIEDAFRVVTSLGGKELHDALRNDMGNNKLLIKAFIKLAPMFTERGIRGGGQAPGGGASGEGEVDLRSVYSKSYDRMTGKSGG